MAHEDHVARLGRIGPARASSTITLNEASKLLAVRRDTVRQWARDGVLHGLLVEVERQKAPTKATGPHPWKKDDQRTMAAASGWTNIPTIRERAPCKSAAKSLPVSGHTFAWRFRRADVLAFKTKREESAQRIDRARRLARVFGGTIKPFSTARPRGFAPLVGKRRKAQLKPQIQSPEVSSNAKLLAWGAPPSLT